MTIPTWPVDLPRPERDTWQKSPQESRVKKNTEVGTPGYRSRYSSVPDQANLSILISRDGKAIFDKFYQIDTARGSQPFYMPDPTTDGWLLLGADGEALLTETGAPILLAGIWLCMFGDNRPTEAVVGLEFRISFSVWVMP